MAIAILSLTPGDKFPETDIQFADIVVHVLMYGFWMAIFIRETGRQFPSNNFRLLIYGAIVMTIYGSIMEYLQEHYASGRFGSWSDFAANLIGTILILLAYRWIFKKN